jgi:hypothetical protein
MYSERIWRAVVFTAALSVLGAGVATAQTVIVRKAAPGSMIEVVLNAATVGTGTVDANGDATVPVNLLGSTGKNQTDAYLSTTSAGRRGAC